MNSLDITNLQCMYCKHLFSNKSNLAIHLRTVKRCKKNIDTNDSCYNCEFCKKNFTVKNSLQVHLSTCKEKLKKDAIIKTEEELDKELSKKILELQDKNIELEEKNNELEEKNKELEEKNKELEEKKELIKQTTLTHLEIHEYKFGSDLVVPIRNDGMINATSLCKAGNKKINDFLRLQNIKDYLNVLAKTGIPALALVKVEKGGSHPGTWVHRKVGYHLAQWISPEFAVQVSNILDELFITGSVILGKEKSSNETEIMYQNQIKELQADYQKLLVKHNSTLKTHRYIKFKESGPCFYIIEQGIPCECKYNISRKKFGVTGLSKNEDEKDTIDDRLKTHRTNWPQLKINYIIFLKEAEIIEQSIKRIYSKEINPNGHEIIEGVSTEQLITSITKIIESLGIVDYKVLSNEKINEYNDYVVTTIKV